MWQTCLYLGSTSLAKPGAGPGFLEAEAYSVPQRRPRSVWYLGIHFCLCHTRMLLGSPAKATAHAVLEPGLSREGSLRIGSSAEHILVNRQAAYCDKLAFAGVPAEAVLPTISKTQCDSPCYRSRKSAQAALDELFWRHVHEATRKSSMSQGRRWCADRPALVWCVPVRIVNYHNAAYSVLLQEKETLRS